MEKVQRIRKTDLARKTRQVIRTVQRGQAAVIENHGEEEAIILDIVDYRILRAVMRYHATHPPVGVSGLSEQELGKLKDNQARWDSVLAHYLSRSISLSRAAELLDLAPFELRTRFHRLQVPLRLGPANAVDIQDDVDAADQWTRKDDK